jgi:large subunit ribosomal protein L21
MDKYAVIQVKSKQYLVKEGNTVIVPKLGENPELQVLILSDGKSVSVGEPHVKGGIKASLVGSKRVKTEVRRYKSKSRYRKNKSHTDEYSLIKIEKIDSTLKTNSLSKEATKTKAATKKPAKDEAKVKKVAKKSVSKKRGK